MLNRSYVNEFHDMRSQQFEHFRIRYRRHNIMFDRKINRIN